MSQKHCFDLCGLYTVFGSRPTRKNVFVFLCQIRAVKMSIRCKSVEILRKIDYNILTSKTQMFPYRLRGGEHFTFSVVISHRNYEERCSDLKLITELKYFRAMYERMRGKRNEKKIIKFIAYAVYGSVACADYGKCGEY